MQELVNNDQKLLDLIKKNPSKGLGLLIETYSGLIYYIVQGKLTDSPQDIEECVSDVFLHFYEQIEAVDLNKGSIKAYLATIATRSAVSVYRKTVARKETAMEEEVTPEIVEERHPESVLLEGEKRNRILQELEKLGEPDTEIMYRRYFLAQPVKEIADIIGMKSNSVTKRISRALDILRGRLEDYHYE